MLSFLGAVIIGSLVLSTNVSAEDSAVTVTTVTVPIACTMRGIGTDSHTATLTPNTYSGASGSEYANGIGKTTLTAICNDDNGFSIYAIGYTGNSYDSENHTKLVGANTGGVIATKAYASGDATSNWSMKLTKVTDSTESYNPQNLTIQSDTEGTFSSWHSVPASYTKVAEYHANTGSSTTDTTLGVKLETTYAAFVASNQPADTYVGQVKYTMVHPYTEEPIEPKTTPSGYIKYYPNSTHVEGTMGRQSISSSATSATLVASNYSRKGYGFAGWSDKYDYMTNPEAKLYGPNETIYFAAGDYTGTNPGLSLYAVWIKSEGSFQDADVVASLCSNGGSLSQASYSGDPNNQSVWSITANLNTISALTDNRDGETYAIAKLTDGRCWMIENLRLSDTHQEGNNIVPTTLSTTNTNNPLNDGTNVTIKHNFTDNTTSATLSPSSSVTYNVDTAPSGWCTSNSSECFDQSRIQTDNIANRAVFNETDALSTGSNLYSYGVYYNWYSAMAGRTSSVKGDICPSGWQLATGGNNGFFALLSASLGGQTTLMNSASSPSASIISARFRHFPNNYVYSGIVTGGQIGSRGGKVSYWSSKTASTTYVNTLDFQGLNSYPGTANGTAKNKGATVRCLFKGQS